MNDEIRLFILHPSSFRLHPRQVGPKGVEPLPSRLKGGSAAGYATTPSVEWAYAFEPRRALHSNSPGF
jgi:hypothetical protein